MCSSKSMAPPRAEKTAAAAENVGKVSAKTNFDKRVALRMRARRSEEEEGERELKIELFSEATPACKI